MRKETNVKQTQKSYKKPELIAKNNPTGSFAAGCPANHMGAGWCKQCERTQ